jgi:hypothetical protein
MKRRFLILLSVASFSSSTLSLLNGDFAKSDLPAIVLPQHVVANGIEAVGWLFVFLLYSGRFQSIARRLAAFLAGMWLWDMTTTLPLTLPLPPFQTIWGPLSLLVMLYAVWPLFDEEQTRPLHQPK